MASEGTESWDGGQGEPRPRSAFPLQPAVERALQHADRRRIVRLLNDSGRPHAPREILGATSALTASQLGYHLSVLERAGIVRRDDSRSLLTSAVAGDAQITRVLGLTRKEDERE